MYQVSQDFKDKMKAQTRKIYGKVQIDYTDPFLDQSIQMQVSESANVSYPMQTADSVLNTLSKIASLDGSWSLDGSYVLAPEIHDLDSAQMGWWGSQLAGAGGSFVNPYPKLTALFLSRPIHSLKVIGDSARNELPVDFTIKLFDSNNTVLHTESVSSNTLVSWQKALSSPITQVTKMELEITKWSHAGKQVKIIEFFTSIQETYEGDDILLIHLLEEREVSKGSLPIGNISSNEIDIRLNNAGRKFDAGNIQSPLYETLKANRRIKAWIGTESELVPLGVFWSGDWNVPENDVYAHVTGRDRIELLRKSTYSTSHVETGFSNEFNGISGHVDLGNPAELQTTGDQTIELWLKPNSFSNRQNPWAKAYGGEGTITQEMTGTLTYFYGIAGGNASPYQGFSTVSKLTLGEWAHVALVRDLQEMKLRWYINGVLTSEVNAIYGAATISSLSAYIGAGYTNTYNGEIAEVRVWDKALSQDEICLYMFRKLPGPLEGLAAYYDFSEGIGSILYDKTLNSNDGTIFNATWKRTGISLANLSAIVLDDAGLSIKDYWIDPELQQFFVPYSYFENQSHREALRKIAEACLGQVYCDREGVVRVEGPSFLASLTEASIEITLDDYFSKDNPVKWSEIANYIEVETQPLRPDLEQEVFISNGPVSIGPGETKTITAFYNHAPCIDQSTSLSGVGNIESETYYAWGANISVNSDTAGEFTLSINAKPLKVLNKEKAIAKDEDSIADNGKLRYVLPSNPLIQTIDIAQTMADKLLSYYKNPRRDAEVNWRGNPALLLGDKVNITDRNEINDYNVAKQELEFNGGLTARLSGRRI